MDRIHAWHINGDRAQKILEEWKAVSDRHWGYFDTFSPDGFGSEAQKHRSFDRMFHDMFRDEEQRGGIFYRVWASMAPMEQLL